MVDLNFPHYSFNSQSLAQSAVEVFSRLPEVFSDDLSPFPGQVHLAVDPTNQTIQSSSETDSDICGRQVERRTRPSNKERSDCENHRANGLGLRTSSIKEVGRLSHL